MEQTGGVLVAEISVRSKWMGSWGGAPFGKQQTSWFGVVTDLLSETHLIYKVSKCTHLALVDKWPNHFHSKLAM